MAVDTQPLDHQALEMTRQEIGQVQRARLLVRERRKLLRPGEELVAVSARQARHAFFLQHPVQQTAGAAVGVGDEHRVKSTPGGVNLPAARRQGCVPGGCAMLPADTAP